jgi:hypothetical protein
MISLHNFHDKLPISSYLYISGLSYFLKLNTDIPWEYFSSSLLLALAQDLSNLTELNGIKLLNKFTGFNFQRLNLKKFSRQFYKSFMFKAKRSIGAKKVRKKIQFSRQLISNCSVVTLILIRQLCNSFLWK